MLKKNFAVFQIIRPINFLIIYCSVIVAGIICTEINSIPSKILFAALAFSFVGSAAYILNDIFDIEIDKINKPLRPLASNALSKKEAWFLFVLSCLLSVIFSIAVNLLSFIIVIVSDVIIFFYSYKIKKIPLAGNITVSLMTGLAFIFGGIAVENVEGAVIPAVFAFMINFIREIVKDMEDIEGDRKNNIQTFPVRYGPRASVNLITLLTIFLFIFTFVPFIFQHYKIEYFIMVMVTVNVLFVYFIKSLVKNKNKENLAKLSSILKLNMVLGLIAIYLGK
jgi:geranylgeranylglycerol-phosphate geranylgeranyltransferase